MSQKLIACRTDAAKAHHAKDVCSYQVDCSVGEEALVGAVEVFLAGKVPGAEAVGDKLGATSLRKPVDSSKQNSAHARKRSKQSLT